MNESENILESVEPQRNWRAPLLNLYLDSLGFHVLVQLVSNRPYAFTSLQGHNAAKEESWDEVK